MLALILSLGYTAVAAKVIAVYRIHKVGFPTVCACLLFSALRTVLALNFSFATRRMLYSVGAPIDLALECLAVVEIFRAVTDNHFPVKLWGTRFLAVFATAAASLSLVGHYFAPTPVAWLQLTLLAERFSVVTMAGFLALTWIILRMTPKIPESPMASRGMWILALHAGCSVAIVELVAVGVRTWWSMSIAPAANGLLAGILWATVFAGSSQIREIEEPVTRDERAKLHYLEEGLLADLKVRRLSAAE